jgi:two-component sensor histidine kinase/ABC-type amino acid transport substrate-binding protein
MTVFKINLVYPFFLLFLLNHFTSSLFSQPTKVEFSNEEKAWIKDHPILKFGYDQDWPPYELVQNGVYKGIVNEYLEIIHRQTGIKMVRAYLDNITLNKQIEKLKKHEMDFISGLVITEKRKKEFLFTPSLANEPLIIATRKDYYFQGGLKELAGKKIAIPIGYYTKELLQKDYPQIEILEMRNANECLMALSTKKVDAVVEVLGVVSYEINHFGFENIQIAAPTEYKIIELAMAFDTTSVILNSIFKKVINNISEKEHNQIRQKWIAVTYDHKNDYTKLIQFLKIFLAVSVCVAILLYLWNLSLRKYNIKIKESEEKLNVSLKQISKQNDERKFLLQEIHHRVKNNLQIITSLLKLQAASNSEKKENFDIDATIDRIKAIGLIHEKIYQSPNLNQTNLNEYLITLVNTIIKSNAIENNVKTDYDIESLQIQIEDMVPLAIIINELVINSLKHGLKGKQDGVITLSFKHIGSDYVLVYSDNGKWIEKQSKNSFGESLIEIFTQQLDGKHELLKDDITKYTITFPKSLLAVGPF